MLRVKFSDHGAEVRVRLVCDCGALPPRSGSADPKSKELLWLEPRVENASYQLLYQFHLFLKWSHTCATRKLQGSTTMCIGYFTKEDAARVRRWLSRHALVVYED